MLLLEKAFGAIELALVARQQHQARTLARELTGEHRAAITRYLDAKPRGRHGVHRYTAADWGFDAGALRTELAEYMAAFAIPVEDG